MIELLAREGVNTIDWCVDNLSIIYTLWYKKVTYTVEQEHTAHMRRKHAVGQAEHTAPAARDVLP